MDEEEFKIEKKKRSRISEVSWKSNLKSQIDNEKAVEEMIALEGKMSYADKLITDTLMTKNNLEASIYGTRDKLSGDWKAFALDSENSSTLDLLQ